MKVLALEPYYGGSHQAFLETWIEGSRHEWNCLKLPPHHWKWRMRHASVTLAERAEQLWRDGGRWDVVFCSDMLSLAEWKGLAPSLATLPAVAYFHENQLTYPVRHQHDRDFHFGMSNITTMLAADQTWFNSEFHRQDFCSAAETWLRRMPDHAPLASRSQLLQASVVETPGCPPIRTRRQRVETGPLHIAWAARWEHDKGPQTFCDAIERLLKEQVDFQLSVMGQVFEETPACLQRLQSILPDSQRRAWGWQPLPQYRKTLETCDVFVSTAEHEFFGLAVLEAIAAGARPLLPRRLSYPELLARSDHQGHFFYDGGANELARRLRQLADEVHRCSETADWALDAADSIRRYQWPRRIEALDQGLESIVA